MSKNDYVNYIGIDISKKYLDVCIRITGETFRTTNDRIGFKKLKKNIKPYKGSLVAMEATGGYESEVLHFLQREGFSVAVSNPRQIRNFGKALGKLAKTDRIDAGIIAHFAEVVKPEPKKIISKDEEELSENQQRRRQLVDMITMEKNRLSKIKGNISRHIKKTIKFLEGQLEEIEKELAQQISKNDEWLAQSKLLCSVKGVGEITATTIIAGLPELGKVSHKEVAALVGVAPLNRDSGNYQGERCIWGGRAEIRTALYMATLVAVKFNPPIKRFYEKLCQKGKKKKVALVACMRKLLTVLNAMAKSRVAWNPN
jgi:transposase